MIKPIIMNKIIAVTILLLFLICILPVPEYDQLDLTKEPADNPLKNTEIDDSQVQDQIIEELTCDTRSARYLENYINLNDAAVQLSIFSEDTSDNAYNVGGARPIATGDIDNDGIHDLIVSCPYADGYEDAIGNGGQVMVIYGRNQTHPYTIYDQADKNYDNINLIIYGANVWDLFGFSIACGDIDGDNYDDLVMSAPFGDGKNNQRGNSGEVYVIYGAPRSELGTEIDLHSVAPDLIIYGEKASDWSGYSVAVGDVVDDPKLDIIIGAVYADPPGRSNTGRVYVVKGDTRSNLGTEINLRTGATVKLNGSQEDGFTGFKVLAEDLNNDDKDDIIMSSIYEGYAGRINSGNTRVVYGKQSLQNTIDLRSSADVYLLGANSYDYSGYSLAVGNVNGDSYNDLIIGAPTGDGPNNGQANTGEVYVFYGSSAQPRIIDTRNNGFDIVIYGEDAHDWFGYAVASGNVDNDNFDDILVGALFGDGEQNGKNNCGDTYLLMGNSTANLGTNIDPRTKSKSIFYGVDVDDNSGRHIGMGDIDGDSHADILISAPAADGPNNARQTVGEFYVIYGSAPRIKNEFFELLNGDVDGRTIFSRYKEYTFRVNVSNLLGYTDFKSVTLTLNPLGYRISYRWTKSKNEFTKIYDPLNLVDCVSTGWDTSHDSNYNYSIDFKFIFNWNFSKNELVACKVTTQGQKALQAEDVYSEVFKVNNKLNFLGEFLVEGEFQGVLSTDSWIRGGEELTFSNLIVVYDGTTDYYPPIGEYSLGIDRNSDITKFFPPAPGKKIAIKLPAPKLTITCDYRIKLLDIPEEADNSSLGLILDVDNDIPPPPNYVICKADSFNESIAAIFDDDQDVYLDWGAVKDKGSGTLRYYYGLENFEGTNNSDFAQLSKLLLKDVPEGLNTIYVWAEDTVGNIGLASSTQIFIDLSEVFYADFSPSGDVWYTSKSIDCSIQIFELGGSGVDVETIEYWNDNKQSWYPIPVEDPNDPSSIEVEFKVEFSEGTDNLIKFRSQDLAGNGPTESGEYYFKIDSTPVTFTGVKPDPVIKVGSEKVRCYIDTHDPAGSGVNVSSIQYSYTSNGVENYTAWNNKNLAIIANQSDTIESVSCFVDLNFLRGADNYVRWRVKDIAGNGFTISEDYAVRVNALPVIIVKDIDSENINSNTEVELNAQDTYDIDDETDSLQFSWHSNISGPLGFDDLVTTKIPAGKHLITLVVFDGLDNASYSFELSVTKPKESKEGSSQFGMGENIDYLLFMLILIIIIIVILSIVVNSRERKKRKALEDKEKLSGRYLAPEISYIPSQSQYRPMSAGGVPVPGIGVTGASASPSITDVTSQPAISTPTVKEQTAPQLSSAGAGASIGVVAAPSSSTVGQQIPKLPPAIISDISGSGTVGAQPQAQAPSQKPEIISDEKEKDIDPKKKLELLDKKMLLGEISVELYNKLSKRYEEKLKGSPPSGEATTIPPTNIPTPRVKQSPTSVSTPSQVQPDVQVQKNEPVLGITPDDPEIQKKLKAEEEKND